MELLNCKKVISYDWMQFHVSIPTVYLSYFEGYKKRCLENEEQNVLAKETFSEYLVKNNYSELVIDRIEFKFRSGRQGKTEESKQTTLGLDIIVDNIHVGTLYCLPHANSILEKTYGSFKIHNKVLYESLFLDNYLTYLFDNTGIQILNITRLDIAIDFPRTEFSNFFGLLKTAHHNTKYLKDESDDVTLEQRKKQVTKSYVLKGHTKVLQTNDANNELVERGFRMFTERTIKDGKERKTSLSKKMVCYNKSREIKESSHKTYIVDYWKSNGLITDKNNHSIQRLEFQARNVELKKYAEIRELTKEIQTGISCDVLLDMLFQVEFMSALLQRLADDFLEMGYVRSTRHKNNKLTANYDTSKNINIKISDKPIVRNLSKPQKNEFNTRSTSITLKQLLKEYYDTNKRRILEVLVEMSFERSCMKELDEKFMRWSYALWDNVTTLDEETINEAYKVVSQLIEEADTDIYIDMDSFNAQARDFKERQKTSLGEYSV